MLSRKVRSTLAISMLVVAITGCSAIGIRPPWFPTGAPLEGEPEIGVPYAIEVYTHCGLRHVEFDGSDWAISGVPDDNSANPPDGFGNPTDHGTVVLTSQDSATWYAEFGAQRTLTRGGGLPWVEGCI